MKSVLFIFFVFTLFGTFAQSDLYLDKIGVYKNGKLKKVNKSTIEKLNITARDSIYANSATAEKYSRLAYTLSKEIEYSEGQIDALLNISGAYVYTNRIDSALIFADIALSIAEQTKNDEKTIACLMLIGGVHTYSNDYEKAVKTYFKGVKMAEKIDEKLAIRCYGNIGHCFKQIGNLSKSRTYCLKSYELAKKYKDTGAVAASLNILGLIESNENDLDKAIKYYEEGLKYAIGPRNLERKSQLLYNLSGIYFDKKDHEKGFQYLNESLEISKVNDSYLQTAIGFQSLAESYFDVGNYLKARIAIDSALGYAKLSENHEILMEVYYIKARIEKQRNNLLDGYNYLEIAFRHKDSLNKLELNDAALNAEESFEIDKQHLSDSLKQVQDKLKAENIKKINDQKIRSRDILLWVSGFILILISIATYILIKKNKLIKAKSITVENQKIEIEIQHKEIKDSINYAKRIQEAMISNETVWNQISTDNFILFKPKDVVSGDFYWAHFNSEKNIAVWAVADCTGHGVPGAFMSMLGIGFLNEIIIERGTLDPGEILTSLRTRIIGALASEKDGQSKDGMDIALCVWNKNDDSLSYSGANNPLWLIRSSANPSPEQVKNTETADGLNLFEISADKMPIGFQLAYPPPFSSKTINLLKGDVIVLFSDGYADQFGGEFGKKLKYKPFKESLLSYQNESLNKQSALLNNSFENWKGSHEQIDDVCVVGVKI